MQWNVFLGALRISLLGLLVLLGGRDGGRAQTAAPPPLEGTVRVCDARLEYFSAIELTRRQPRFLLTNRIGNKDVKLVNDIDWMKPQVSSPELAVGGVVEASYPTSNYVHDKDAPIKIWYQGCEAPAEAYLVTTEEKSAVDRLNSLLRRFVEGKPELGRVGRDHCFPVQGAEDSSTRNSQAARQPDSCFDRLRGMDNA